VSFRQHPVIDIAPGDNYRWSPTSRDIGHASRQYLSSKESLMRAFRHPILLAILGLVLLCPATPAAGQSTPIATPAPEATWLDGSFASWNHAGMPIPTAPDVDGNDDPRCADQERPAETEQDTALIAKGWHLFLPYQRGWDVTLVWGLAGYDGMCRPWGFQVFVFVGDTFAGTISPDPMFSRTDGAADTANLWSKDQASAEFRRYTSEDPLCCPSSSTSVEYTIESTADGPVLNPMKPQQ
jgi:hypothetical protein